jgi:ABC-type phosphate transport system substrate-binding protein
MRRFTKLMTTVVSVAAVATLTAGVTQGVAKADPPKGVTPQAYDYVGVGSNTTQYVLDQMSVNYNAKVGKHHSSTDPYLYSFDATPPSNPTSTSTFYITPKLGCSGTDKKTHKTIKIVRPNGSGAGVSALNANQFDDNESGAHYCIDFARSSSGPAAGANLGSGGDAYVPFATDAVTWGVRDKAAGGTDAPANLTVAQLKEIYSCQVTNWSKLGGKSGAIKPYVPQANSGTRKFFLTALGLSNTSVASCVGQQPEENEGTYAGFNNAGAIFPFSIGAYVAQGWHSMSCKAKAPAKGQNAFGCDSNGILTLGSVNGVAPLATAKGAKAPTINPVFAADKFKLTSTTTVKLGRTLYNVLRYTTQNKYHILSRLLPIFGPDASSVPAADRGYICSSAATSAIEDYGFLTTPLCGYGD